MNTIFDFWEQVLQRMSGQLQPDTIDLLMRYVLPVAFHEENKEIVLQVSKPFFKVWLEQNVLPLLHTELHNLTGNEIQVIITVPNMPVAPFEPSVPTPSIVAERAGGVSPAGSITRSDPALEISKLLQPPEVKPAGSENTNNIPPQTTLSPVEPEIPLVKLQADQVPIDASCTFDSFIVGQPNQIAFSAAQAVAKNSAGDAIQLQNPLFIYGESGLGKTHLMHAVCNYLTEHAPDKKFVFLSSEAFTNDFIESLHHRDVRSTQAFRQKYRSVDYLLIDDVQFFGKKEGTQEEFFHTFNDLINSKKQIIMTCDRLPDDMEKVEKRLISRFLSGLVVEIKPPNYEIIAAFLKKQAANSHIVFANDVIPFLVENFSTDFREIKGIFNQIAMSYSLHPVPILTMEWLETHLADRLPKKKKVILNPDLIIQEVSAYYKIRREKLVGKTRTKNIVVPRQVAMYLCRELLDISFKEIADAFNKQDHTTIIHAREKIETEMRKNEILQQDVHTLTAILKGE